MGGTRWFRDLSGYSSGPLNLASWQTTWAGVAWQATGTGIKPGGTVSSYTAIYPAEFSDQVDAEIVARAMTTSSTAWPIVLVVRGEPGPAADGYVASFDGSNLRLYRLTKGNETWLGAASGAGTSKWHWIRLQMKGNTLRCRIWQDGGPEPSAWNIEVVDTTYPRGFVGVGAQGSNAGLFSAIGVGTEGEAAPTEPVDVTDTIHAAVRLVVQAVATVAGAGRRVACVSAAAPAASRRVTWTKPIIQATTARLVLATTAAQGMTRRTVRVQDAIMVAARRDARANAFALTATRRIVRAAGAVAAATHRSVTVLVGETIEAATARLVRSTAAAGGAANRRIRATAAVVAGTARRMIALVESTIAAATRRSTRVAGATTNSTMRRTRVCVSAQGTTRRTTWVQASIQGVGRRIARVAFSVVSAALVRKVAARASTLASTLRRVFCGAPRPSGSLAVTVRARKASMQVQPRAATLSARPREVTLTVRRGGETVFRWYPGNTGTFEAVFRNGKRQRADAEGVTITITRVETGEVVPTDPNLIVHEDMGVYLYDWVPEEPGEYLAEFRGVVDGSPELIPLRVLIRDKREAPVVG